MVTSVSLLLSEIISENPVYDEKSSSSLNKKSSKITNSQTTTQNVFTQNIFFTKRPPSITLESYLERIIKYTRIEDSTLILALIYLDRLCESQKFKMNTHNIHRLLLTSVVIAIKYNEDDYYSNTFYAKVGGIKMEEMNSLEVEYLRLLKYTLFVDADLYSKYKVYLMHYEK